MSVNTISQDEFFKKFDKGNKKCFMKGEVTASDTLDKVTKISALDDFNVKITNRHVGITSTGGLSTEKILEIVKEAIKNKSYDDPVRKAKPLESEKKVIEITGEKSKLSLADEYLNMFKKEENCLRMKGDAHDEIRKKMSTLFADLDTLFHTNYIPIKQTAESRLLFKAPETGIEEIGISNNKTVSRVTPQEAMSEAKISEMKGTSERTQLDRKRKKQIFGQQMQKKKPKTD